ncbi:quinolinate synthase, chloroplastic-like [Chenopodium quinoa]|uniref:quinolinate synthase, chloroplastic-like n=1 Tax=Chenopodium quinoa TaxID=63459 RepID=UPI000B772D1F|nr:quinolinate synthase, chloroplastic-like [Chenopodium quinoa]
MNSPATSSSSSSRFFSSIPSLKPPSSSSITITRFPFSNSTLNFSLLKTTINHNSSPSSFVCAAAITSTPVPETSDLAASKFDRLIAEFLPLTDPVDRVKHLLTYAANFPPLDEENRTAKNRVMGCTTQVWVDAKLDEEGRMRFMADSDSELSRGFCGCLIWVLDGAFPEEVLNFKIEDLGLLNFGGISGGVNSRANTWYNVLISMQKKTKFLVAEKDGKVFGEPFPSMVISADGIAAKGSFAETQARYLFPDESQVNDLVKHLKEKNIGIVAHFYMDPEVQGVLTAAQKQWPHIHISDSLVMADRAVNMAKAGCQFIAVLGVDFMSENVRAILDQAGYDKVGVYRMSDERIGCSLADAAATTEYMKYLEIASLSPPSLHVIYINTSLETKAHAHELVPTITCTSSNAVQTILQAFAQIPDLTVYYGPDSYMGANIAELFQQMALMSDEEISAVHPQHNRNSIRSLLPRLQYFQDGTCIVHDLFGHDVVEKINEMYFDAFLTAHFEVPGEMFSLAMEAKRRGMGVVGSTQNILDFIKQRLQEALDRNIDDNLQFVLGTESGMITSIAATVREMLTSPKLSPKRADINVEIVFPVSSDSVSNTKDTSCGSSNSTGVEDPVNLTVVPGVTSGEGCSIHGGCASCPYMKMNSLSALLKVCQNLPNDRHVLSAYEAGRFSSETVNGRSIADVGCEPILHMRHFQAHRELPKKLIHQVCVNVMPAS